MKGLLENERFEAATASSSDEANVD